LPPSALETPGALSRRIVVSDAGPLISLGRLDLLSVLPALFASVQVPEQVLRECAARPNNADAARITIAMQTGWVLPCGMQAVEPSPLGRGERAAIARALSIGAGLLTDDHAARVHAQSLQLAVTGTLGVLIRAKRAGLLASVAPQIELLRASGQRFGKDVVGLVLAAAGEALP
jgi:uncharacterized protein